MPDATLILNNPLTGVPEAFRMPLEKLEAGVLPADMAGPFRYRMMLEATNGPQEFDATLMMSSTRLQVAFTEYPVIAKVLDGYNLAGPALHFLEYNDRNGVDMVLRLKAAILGKTHIWLDINAGVITGGTYSTKDKKAYVLPFYNFHNHGAVCMGNCGRHNNPLVQLNLFLGSFMTPHHTYAGNHKFKPSKDKTQVVVDQVPASTPFDFAVDRRLFEKPIATITP